MTEEKTMGLAQLDSHALTQARTAFWAKCGTDRSDPALVHRLYAGIIAYLAHTQPAENKQWRCFHCDEVFTDVEAAADHFGAQIDGTAACKLSATDGLLVKMLREAQSDLRKYHQEDDAHCREFYALGAEHAAALIRAEQTGYDRGLADAKNHPETLGLLLSPPADPSRSPAASDVLAERKRQIESEGWSADHDDQHVGGGLAKAAACYALGRSTIAETVLWPWDWGWWKPKDRRRDLVRAGALIIAELERLDRQSPTSETST